MTPADTLPFNHLDNESFELAIYELQNGPVNFDHDRLASLNFNPLCLDINNRVTLTNDLDPDSNFCLNSDHCKYYIEDQFNDMLSKQSQHINFSLLNLNIRSLPRNFDNLTNLLAHLNMQFSAIGITETWLQDSTHLVDINGYEFIHKHRSSRPGGGVGLYLSNDLDYTTRVDVNIDEVAESLFVEINRSQGKNVIVGVIYRPPNQNINEFINKYNELVTYVSKQNKLCYIMGDFNLDLMKFQDHLATSEFLEGMYSNMFYPLITRPTRITTHTATLIDNIFTNDPNNHLNGLLLNDISDHLPIFAILHGNIDHNSSNNNPTMTRVRSKENINKFKEQLRNIDWMEIEGYNNPHSAYTSFLEKYTKVYNTCFPLKRTKTKYNVNNKPWLSKGLLKSINRKNKLYKKYLSSPNPNSESCYKNYKNKLNHSLRIAKRLYYEKKLIDSKSNIKNTWKILNEIINKKNRKSKLPSTFKINNQETSNPTEIANKFCSYFSSIGPELAKSIQNPSKTSHKSFLTSHFTNSIVLSPTTEKEIKEIVSNLQAGKAAGYDNIPVDMIKQTIEYISKPLTHIINLSIAHSIVPDELKIARVIPLYKAGDPTDFTNYRPVSILPCFSKLFERVIYNRFIKYINKHNILNKNQYGFRKQHSTSHALIDLVDKITSAIDRKEFTIGVFLDLSKAFDTVNFDILFDKLEYYGIRGLALDWVKSYFSNRSQFVQYNEYCSSAQTITCGVPQGSILGPLFFLLYINDIDMVSDMVDLILFADDTNVFSSHKDLQCLIEIITNEIDKLSKWFIANKLSLNIKKTNLMVFQPRQKKTYNIQLSINNQQIKQVEKTVFLGLIIDSHLTWKLHIAHVANKISKSIGILYKSSFYLFKSSLRVLYFSLVYPYLQYCTAVWASTYPTNLRRVQILQKRALRVLNKSNFNEHTSPIFKKFNTLKLVDIYFLQVGQFMYSYNNQLLPQNFNHMFLNNQTHNYNTRICNHFKIPFCRTKTRQFSIIYQGPKYFNSLSSDIRDAPSSNLFKLRLKYFIISLY